MICDWCRARRYSDPNFGSAWAQAEGKGLKVESVHHEGHIEGQVNEWRASAFRGETKIEALGATRVEALQNLIQL